MHTLARTANGVPGFADLLPSCSSLRGAGEQVQHSELEHLDREHDR
ncbi:MAG: hypothetical protein NVS4B7_21420 [Ktedonobacteraceae bacterium]